jgi:hypothetical protein
VPRPLPPVREFWLADDDDPPPGPAPGPCPSLRPSPALRSWVWVGFVQSVSGVKGCPEGMCPARWVRMWTDRVRMPRRTGTRARSPINPRPFQREGLRLGKRGGGQKVAPTVDAFGTYRSSCSRRSVQLGRACHRPTSAQPPPGPSSPRWSTLRPPSMKSPIDRFRRFCACKIPLRVDTCRRWSRVATRETAASVDVLKSE